ncbi:MAG: hypothetical protein QM500_19940 [Methylococcales bacterium]
MGMLFKHKNQCGRCSISLPAQNSVDLIDDSLCEHCLNVISFLNQNENEIHVFSKLINSLIETYKFDLSELSKLVLGVIQGDINSASQPYHFYDRVYLSDFNTNKLIGSDIKTKLSFLLYRGLRPETIVSNTAVLQKF